VLIYILHYAATKAITQAEQEHEVDVNVTLDDTKVIVKLNAEDNTEIVLKHLIEFTHLLPHHDVKRNLFFSGYQKVLH
jgi:hypothetical protein